jgi:hypothetical protein
VGREAEERDSRDAKRYFGVFPMHAHVDCRCGDATCEANIRITVLADGRRVEVWAVDDRRHPGILLDGAGTHEISRVAAELLAEAAKHPPGETAKPTSPDHPTGEEEEA